MTRNGEEIYGYITLCKNYLGEGTFCTSPNSLGSLRRIVQIGEENLFPLNVDEEGNLVSVPELKTLYAVYKNPPSPAYVRNMNESNNILLNQDKTWVNVVRKVRIPKDSFVEDAILSEINGVPEQMILTNCIIIEE